MYPFSEVGREINSLQDDVRQIKSSLYRYVETHELNSAINAIRGIDARISNLENDLSWIKESIQELKDRETK